MWGGCFLWSGATPFRWCALYFSYAKADYVFEIPDIPVNDVNIQQKTSQPHFTFKHRENKLPTLISDPRSTIGITYFPSAPPCCCTVSKLNLRDRSPVLQQKTSEYLGRGIVSQILHRAQGPWPMYKVYCSTPRRRSQCLKAWPRPPLQLRKQARSQFGVCRRCEALDGWKSSG